MKRKETDSVFLASRRFYKDGAMKPYFLTIENVSQIAKIDVRTRYDGLIDFKDFANLHGYRLIKFLKESFGNMLFFDEYGFLKMRSEFEPSERNVNSNPFAFSSRANILEGKFEVTDENEIISRCINDNGKEIFSGNYANSSERTIKDIGKKLFLTKIFTFFARQKRNGEERVIPICISALELSYMLNYNCVINPFALSHFGVIPENGNQFDSRVKNIRATKSLLSASVDMPFSGISSHELRDAIINKLLENFYYDKNERSLINRNNPNEKIRSDDAKVKLFTTRRDKNGTERTHIRNFGHAVAFTSVRSNSFRLQPKGVVIFVKDVVWRSANNRDIGDGNIVKLFNITGDDADISNLYVCKSEESMKNNRLSMNNKSGRSGVSSYGDGLFKATIALLDKESGKWVRNTLCKGVTFEEAVRAREKAELENGYKDTYGKKIEDTEDARAVIESLFSGDKDSLTKLSISERKNKFFEGMKEIFEAHKGDSNYIAEVIRILHRRFVSFSSSKNKVFCSSVENFLNDKEFKIYMEESMSNYVRADRVNVSKLETTSFIEIRSFEEENNPRRF